MRAIDRAIVIWASVAPVLRACARWVSRSATPLTAQAAGECSHAVPRAVPHGKRSLHRRADLNVAGAGRSGSGDMVGGAGSAAGRDRGADGDELFLFFCQGLL